MKTIDFYTERTPAHREGGDGYYKAVQICGDGRMFSLYDGQTEYVLNQPMHDAPRQAHKGGIYVYRSSELAHSLAEQYYPIKRCVILRCKCEGSYCVYSNKLAFSTVTPIEIVG